MLFFIGCTEGIIVIFLYILILYLGRVCPYYQSSSCPGPMQKAALFYLLFKYVRYINHIQPPLPLPFILPPPTNTHLFPVTYLTTLSFIFNSIFILQRDFLKVSQL
jgi:hypothetical protein